MYTMTGRRDLEDNVNNGDRRECFKDKNNIPPSPSNILKW